ncbi:MAG: FAD-binding oxidoreductase [Candidatus Nanopelagicales bacterium]|nr:FAD-binding oxidoreductase [Candidatus Nanopelagicales bacterium]MCF8537126.1 FAD-binding oxidoreductase [Candidatus Nanopelagicales bacterium]MCF8542165.1 FAD-binding oxidoreductase [Candidatus Nanopelagicales bacterium]MCF8556948.1 FAD-binding oxidoreductase [Candidatus Nanopelagicales bacterium]
MTVVDATGADSPLSLREGEQTLTGWGRTAPSAGIVRRVRTVDDIRAAISDAGPRGILARGLGRSYGDAAQSGGASILDLSAMNRIELDPATGTAHVGAGASLDSVMRALVPHGWFVPVTPGTRMVTVGGAIAADVHGKNHHRDGTFGSHVETMTLVDGRGEVHVVDRESSPEAFWATVGGMGLTGIVTQATFDLIPITSSRISVDTERTSSLDDVMDRMITGDDAYRYSVAWVDSVHPSGRGVLTRGDHASADQLAGKAAQAPLEFEPKVLATAPPIPTNGLVNPLTMRAFNEAWFRKAPKQRTGELQTIAEFFHPLDIVQDWNRVYGPSGFLQYQFAVPDSAGELVGRALAALRGVGALSALTVLKRFGAANPGPLSFPQPGWTLAVDVPAGVDGLGVVLDQLDDEVLAAGGRLYLAKDSRMSPAMMAATYPRLSEWQRHRDALDPQGVFTSDLARRLSL